MDGLEARGSGLSPLLKIGARGRSGAWGAWLERMGGAPWQPDVMVCACHMDSSGSGVMRDLTMTRTGAM